MKRIISALILLPCLAASAQELKGNVDVEGLYKPDIIRQERLNALPEPPSVTFETFDMNYDTGGQAVDFAETLSPMPATLWGASRSISPFRGYVKAGLGSYLNSDLSAGYSIVSTTSTTLGAALQFNSSSLWRPYGKKALTDGFNRRYDGRFALRGSHIFQDIGSLDASMAFALSYFNYYGYNPASESGPVSFPYQALNEFDFKASWKSYQTRSLDWSAFAGLTYTGFRDLYLPASQGSLLRLQGQRETDVNLGASFRFPLPDGSAPGIDARFDYLAYSNPSRLALPSDPLRVPDVDDYALLSLNPYYSFSRGLLNIRVGADIDLAFNAGPSGSRYSFFHIAPDVRFDWRKGGVGLFLHALGGSELQTLSRARAIDYYATPALYSTRPVYIPLDARLGATFGPFGGFSATLSGAYRIARRTPLGGLYSALLSSSGLPDHTILSPDNYTDIKGFRLNLDLDYKLGSTLRLGASAAWSPQDGSKGWFNGFDRPEWVARATVKLTPVKDLSISLDYNLRALRTIYWRNPGPDGSLELLPASLPNYHSLSLAASYALTDAFSLWISADNLTCRRNYILPSLPSQRLTLLGGISFKF